MAEYSEDETFVDDFRVSEGEEDDVDYEKPKKRRGMNRIWLKVQDFECPEIAENFIKSQEIWTKASTNRKTEDDVRKVRTV